MISSQSVGPTGSPGKRPVWPGTFLAVAALLCIAAGSQPSSTGGDATATAPNDSRTMIVTSDSGAYCRTLSGAIEAHGTLSREVSELKTQGDGLCDEGQIRSGINRLRRALLVLTHGNMQPGEPDAP